MTETVSGCTSLPDTVPVSIINCPPDAVDDNYFVNEDQVLSDDVTTNDTDPNGDILTITLVNGGTVVANGTLVLNTNGTFTYTPNPNFYGIVSFIYSACDNGVPLPVLCDTAIVNITVNPVNDVPTAEADNSTVNEDDTNVSIPVLVNDTFGGGPAQARSRYTPPANGRQVWMPAHRMIRRTMRSYHQSNYNGQMQSSMRYAMQTATAIPQL
ncbi:MAG: cadherin-like domain-containing protein [Sphingobacteriales bacterium]|nr:cadherin-like domain-containing protein [Sphingobacteriales bacterium]